MTSTQNQPAANSVISQGHANRKAYNWLVYDIGDQLLQKFSSHYKGDLYDLGCGEMPYRDWFLRYADRYVGVDWSGTLHELKADVVADLNLPLPIKDRVADTVVSLSVMEHLREPQNMLNEAFRILKPGGSVVLQVPFMWWVHEAPHDYYRYTCYGLKYMFEKAGFTNVEVIPQSGFWVMWTLKFNYQSTRLIRGPWPLRKMMSALLHVIWQIDQRIAPWVDKHWRCEEETAGYFAVAKKP
jgi:SAM-dependent methyltransferase